MSPFVECLIFLACQIDQLLFQVVILLLPLLLSNFKLNCFFALNLLTSIVGKSFQKWCLVKFGINLCGESIVT